MEGYAYYNGKIGKCRDISIPLTDRLIYFGDGITDIPKSNHYQFIFPVAYKKHNQGEPESMWMDPR